MKSTEDWQAGSFPLSEALHTVWYNLLTNIGRKGDFMHSWVQIDHIRWRALAMQVSREPLQRYGESDGVGQTGHDDGTRESIPLPTIPEDHCTYISLYISLKHLPQHSTPRKCYLYRSSNRASLPYSLSLNLCYVGGFFPITPTIISAP